MKFSTASHRESEPLAHLDVESALRGVRNTVQALAEASGPIELGPDGPLRQVIVEVASAREYIWRRMRSPVKPDDFMIVDGFVDDLVDLLSSPTFSSIGGKSAKVEVNKGVQLPGGRRSVTLPPEWRLRVRRSPSVDLRICRSDCSYGSGAGRCSRRSHVDSVTEELALPSKLPSMAVLDLDRMQVKTPGWRLYLYNFFGDPTGKNASMT